MEILENPFVVSEKRFKPKNIFLDFLQNFAIAVSVSLFIYVFVITPNEVDGVSMEPTFESGDLVFTSKLHIWMSGTSIGNTLGLTYQRGDIVVFQKPGLEDYVKRIIAVPNDTIAIRGGKYIVNGIMVDEDFDIKNANRDDGAFLKDVNDGGKVVTLGQSQYFVSGDNRDKSFDSRDLGLIDKTWIKGKVFFRFSPLEKIGIIGRGSFTAI